MRDILITCGKNMPYKVVHQVKELNHRVVEKILSENNINAINVIALTKDKSHKAKSLIGDAEIIKKFQKEIILVNAEAHRFALNYHKNLRKKSFLRRV